MKANVIIKVLVFFSSIVLLNSCKIKNENNFYQQAFPNILDSYFSYKLKYVAPKYDSINDKLVEMPFANADTMPKLRVYVQKTSFSLENIDKNYVKRIPKEFHVPLKNLEIHKSFFPKDINEFKSDKYNIIFFSDYRKIVNIEDFKKYSFSNAGMLQFSDIIFNKEKNKVLVFIRWYRSKLNGNESVVIFHLENGKWIDKGGFELSIS